MTTSTNLLIRKRNIEGNTDGTDNLVLFCSEVGSEIATIILKVDNASSDDKTKFVAGVTITPAITVTPTSSTNTTSTSST